MRLSIQTPSQLATHVRALRTAKGWSQSQLGMALNLSQARIARIEKDPLSISVAQLLRVLAALGATVSVEVIAEDGIHGTLPPPTLGATATQKSNAGDW